MTKSELAHLIGELVSMEIDDVANVSYEFKTDDDVNFIVKMENGKKFIIKILDAHSRNDFNPQMV